MRVLVGELDEDSRRSVPLYNARMDIATNPMPMHNPGDHSQRGQSRSSVVLGLISCILILSIGLIVYLLTHSIAAAGVPLLLGLVATIVRIGIKASIGLFLLLMPLQWLVDRKSVV